MFEDHLTIYRKCDPTHQLIRKNKFVLVIMTESEAKSIHTLIRELQSIIKNSQEQWGLNVPKGQGDKGDKSQTNIAIANCIYLYI